MLGHMPPRPRQPQASLASQQTRRVRTPTPRITDVLKAGQSFHIPAGAKHDACTTGGMKILAAYIVEKGKPLATPAP